ncbi:hypothetical protein MHSWG343_04410 [Candidatus Mycoplasma haematohominis]|uniref:Uncharacterized protein n=1 Tax=Candidatus Mycoplasma haematohominis TaxID=1494318 RepID=A0A478FR36_9MOLU|nr:hypothetical protein MHSWG343_04410 [Candidatus Mycoplasma haemohominis]
MNSFKLFSALATISLCIGVGFGLYDSWAWVMPENYELLAFSESGTDKVGHFYKGYLVDAYKENNRDWWEWSYKWWNYDLKNLPDSMHADFKSANIKVAFAKANETDGSNVNGLNQVCDSIYKKTKNEVFKSDNSTPKLSENLLRYCSPIVKEPTVISEANGVLRNHQKKEEVDGYSNSTYGSTYKNTLISVTDSRNDLFWTLKDKEFFGETESGTSSTGSQDNIFKKLRSTGNANKGHAVKRACKEAYSTSTTNNNSQETDIFKYCSWSGTKTNNS